VGRHTQVIEFFKRTYSGGGRCSISGLDVRPTRQNRPKRTKKRWTGRALNIFEYGQSGAPPLNNTAQPPRTAAHAYRRICDLEIEAFKIGIFERGEKRTLSKSCQKPIKTAQK